MPASLLPFYERELSTLRGLAAEFAARHPHAARRLQLDPDRCDDPQVERLLQAFAWFGARLQRRLDDDLPELAEPILQLLGPAWLRPVPSATILQLRLPPQRAQAARTRIPRHAQALSPPIQGVRCPFRTCHSVDLWPLTVARAGLEFVQPRDRGPGAGPALALGLELVTGHSVPFPELGVDKLRFFLDGEPELTGLLYELLCYRVQDIRVSGPESAGRVETLSAGSLYPVGFSAQEALFGAGPPEGPEGHRLLFECFTFPDKFRFVELAGLDSPRLAHLGSRVRLQVVLTPLPGREPPVRQLAAVSAPTFKLGCVPAVNLFPLAADPIPLAGARPPLPGSGLPITAAGHPSRAFEPYAIDSAHLCLPGDPEGPGLELPPLFSLQHGTRARDSPWSWQAVREAQEGPPGPRGDPGLAIADGASQPSPGGLAAAAGASVRLQLTCCSRNLPEALGWAGPGEEQAEFILAGHATQAQARPLRRPSPRLPPPAQEGRLWPILAHLAMNQPALARLDRAGLEGWLALYPGAGNAAWARQLRGLRRVEALPATRLLSQDGMPQITRGLRVELGFGPTALEGGGPWLFAAVLERFLAQLCPWDSFIETSLCREDGVELLRWPPRRGTAPLL